MRIKKIVIIMLIFTIIMGIENYSYSQINENKTLIIYPSSISQDNNELRVLDMTVGHFSSNIDTITSNQSIEDINKYDYIIYYGLNEEVIKDEMIENIDTFKGKLIGIGYNVEQIKSRFSFVEYGVNVPINSITFNGSEHTLNNTEYIRHITSVNNGNVIYNAKKDSVEYPWLISDKHGDTYYFPFISIFSDLSEYLGEGLFDCYGMTKNKKTNQISLRLEDINPTRDPETLMEVAKYLKSKNITYMAVVIPTYRDVANNKTYHLKDFPEMINVLKYMQDNGGSIVMHGYTHQYRDSETGEGFEFWDSESDTPIENPNGISETEYIKSKLESGVEELVTHGLYPIAFEAPHYAISQNGYKVVSEYFSTYVGEIQLSDKTMKSTYSPQYISTPSFLNGMTVIPENLGYIELDSIKEDIKNINNEAKIYNDFSESLISVFYHPHLGVDNLKDLVESLEKTTNATWFNLRDIDASVDVSDISIQVKDGEIIANIPIVISEYQLKIWVEMAYIGIVILSSILVLIYVFRGRLSLSKKKKDNQNLA